MKTGNHVRLLLLRVMQVWAGKGSVAESGIKLALNTTNFTNSIRARGNVPCYLQIEKSFSIFECVQIRTNYLPYVSFIASL